MASGPWRTERGALPTSAQDLPGPSLSSPPLPLPLPSPLHAPCPSIRSFLAPSTQMPISNHPAEDASQLEEPPREERDRGGQVVPEPWGSLVVSEAARRR